MSQFKMLVRNMETFSNVLSWFLYPLNNCLHHAFVVSGLALIKPNLTWSLNEFAYLWTTTGMFAYFSCFTILENPNFCPLERATTGYW